MQSEFKMVSEVTPGVKLAFDREDITIPFPIRTLHIPDGGEKGAGEIRMTDDGGPNGSKGGP